MSKKSIHFIVVHEYSDAVLSFLAKNEKDAEKIFREHLKCPDEWCLEVAE